MGIYDEGSSHHPVSGYKYSPQSIQNVFSCTKALSSIVVAMLVDKGYIRYDMPIAEIWPGKIKYSFFLLFAMRTKECSCDCVCGYVCMLPF